MHRSACVCMRMHEETDIEPKPVLLLLQREREREREIHYIFSSHLRADQMCRGSFLETHQYIASYCTAPTIYIILPHE